MLERAFGREKGVTIHSPHRLRDKDTGKLREHDVVIVRKSHHGETLTAVECKDRGRPVGVDFVEQFSKKNEKTGIHHGIIVSATGFAETAKTKAKALNITCMTLWSWPWQHSPGRCFGLARLIWSRRRCLVRTTTSPVMLPM